MQPSKSSNPSKARLSAIAAAATLAALVATPGSARAQQPPPPSAAMMLDRAAAAYEYGDLNQVIEATRPVAEGAVPAGADQRADALRLLGISLYLTGRVAGAQVAFDELLRRYPDARLDPTITRPEVVAFFEDVRRRQRKTMTFAWNFLPPLGQFQNGDTARGAIVIGLEAASLGTTLVTLAILKSWQGPNDTFRYHTSAAKTMKTVNHVAVAALVGTYLLGVADAIVRFDREPARAGKIGLLVLPNGAGLSVRF